MKKSTTVSLLCTLFLIGCGGSGTSPAVGLEPLTPPPTPPPTALFNTEPIVLNDPQNYYNTTCGSPSISSVIPVDINGDEYDDFVIHYWCDQEEFGTSVRGETANILVAFVSDGYGGYNVDNYNVFGESYPSLGGASRKYKVFDINGDGKDDIAYAMNNEDGRSAFTWEDQLSNGTQPSVLLSTENGFTIERMGEEDWGHAVSITETGDVIFAGFNYGTQAFRLQGEDWIDVTSEYPAVSPSSHLIKNGTIANAERRSDSFGFYLTKIIDDTWQRFAEYMFTKDFDVYWESWNNSGTGNYDPYPVTTLYGKKYFGAMFDTMCEFDGMLIAKLNAATLKDGTEPVEGQYYQQTDTYPVNMLLFFALVDEEIVLQDSPITEEDINVNYNDWSCGDVNNDGSNDIVASVFSEPWIETRENRGGVPIVYLNDGTGKLSSVDVSEWPIFSQDVSTAGFLHDIDNSGTTDLIIHTLSTDQVRADIEIYTTNKDISG